MQQYTVVIKQNKHYVSYKRYTTAFYYFQVIERPICQSAYLTEMPKVDQDIYLLI